MAPAPVCGADCVRRERPPPRLWTGAGGRVPRSSACGCAGAPVASAGVPLPPGPGPARRAAGVGDRRAGAGAPGPPDAGDRRALAVRAPRAAARLPAGGRVAVGSAAGRARRSVLGGQGPRARVRRALRRARLDRRHRSAAAGNPRRGAGRPAGAHRGPVRDRRHPWPAGGLRAGGRGGAHRPGALRTLPQPVVARRRRRRGGRLLPVPSAPRLPAPGVLAMVAIGLGLALLELSRRPTAVRG